MGFADNLQPDLDTRNPWFWSDCARFQAGRELAAEQDEWAMGEAVPSYGIHLRVGELHIGRVVRTLHGSTPHPGRNPARRRAWSNPQPPVQGQLPLGGEANLPPLSVILDWHERAGEPEVHIGLPIGPWRYQKAPRLHWRVPLPDDAADLDALRFDPGPDTSDTFIEIDPAWLRPLEGEA